MTNDEWNEFDKWLKEVDEKHSYDKWLSSSAFSGQDEDAHGYDENGMFTDSWHSHYQKRAEHWDWSETLEFIDSIPEKTGA